MFKILLIVFGLIFISCATTEKKENECVSLVGNKIKHLNWLENNQVYACKVNDRCYINFGYHMNYIDCKEFDKLFDQAEE